MGAHRKLVWAEGILLGQQHFQYWDSYLQNQQQLFQFHAHPFHWGIAELALDENFLAQGMIRLNRCVVLLKDRQWIVFDHTVDGHLTHPIPENTTSPLSVFLAWPEAAHVAGISGYPESQGPTAWEGIYQWVKDTYDPNREREVLLAKQNLRLLLQDESREGLSTLKIAELEFNAQQSAYRLSRSFVPPLLKIGGSLNLTSWLAGFIGKLIQTIKILNEQKEKHRHVQNQFGYADFIYFNLIKTLTTHWPKLTVLQQLPQCHPYYLYETCVTLLGELWGYLDAPLDELPLPVYRHEDLSDVFANILMRLEDLIRQVMPANTLDIVLNRISETQFQSAFLDEQELKMKQFCLALYHENISMALIDKILAQVKISAPSRLTDIIHSFTQGIEFKYLSSPGKDLLAKRHYHYFLLDKQSSGWETVVAERMISIFVSQELATCQFELISYS